ncbi:MAG: SMP-30/gluconolactonase/LRE family protein [Gammaproteobacteria bacterium]
MGRDVAVLADGFEFLEGPRWRDGRLWFSDMWDHSIHTVTEDGTVVRVATVPERPSGLNFLPDGRLVVVSMGDRRLYVVGEDGGLEEYADLSLLVDTDINDSVVDAAGNIFVGHFGYDLLGGADPAPASLIRVAPDGSATVAAEDMMFPNGTVITPDGGTLVCAETFGNRLTAFDLAADGSLSGRRVWAELGEHTPDGICLDEDGAIWVSSFVAGEFLRVAEGGTITDTIACPGKCAVACNLGGADGRTLFLLTFAGQMEEIGGGGRKAQIETCRVDVAAAGSP